MEKVMKLRPRNVFVQKTPEDCVVILNLKDDYFRYVMPHAKAVKFLSDLPKAWRKGSGVSITMDQFKSLDRPTQAEVDSINRGDLHDLMQDLIAQPECVGWWSRWKEWDAQKQRKRQARR
jgi:hypothetical protein